MKTKIALCGYGPMGRTHAQILHRLENVELVGVADVQESLRQRAEKELSVQTWTSGEALIDARLADAVYVCTPTYLHAPLGMRALEQGQHVFTEKPMGLNTDECTAMIDTAQRAGRLLTVGQVLRFWPEYVYLKQTLAGGSLGRLLTLSMTRIGGVSHGWQEWFLDEALGGTQIFDRHIHDTDLTLWLLGKPAAVRVYGSLGDVGGFNHTFTRYVYPGVTVAAEGSADMPGFPFTMAYVAAFERGAIEYSNRLNPTLTVYREGSQPEHPALPNPLGQAGTGLNVGSVGGYYLEDVYFVDCVRNGRRPDVVTPESARETVRLVRLEMQSARQDRTVRVR